MEEKKLVTYFFWFFFFYYFLSKYKNALLLIWTYKIPFVWQIHPYCWFKFNNLELALGMALKFCESVAKGLKLNIRKFLGIISVCRSSRGKTGWGCFLALHILNRVNLFPKKIIIIGFIFLEHYNTWINDITDNDIPT